MKKFLVLIIISSFLIPSLHAGDPHPSGLKKTTVSWAKHALQQAGGFTMWMSNQMIFGEQAWDGSVPGDHCKNPGLGCSYPPSSCIEHLFGAGPWIGGTIDGVRIVAQGYNGNAGYGYFLPAVKDTSRDQMWTTNSSDTLYDQNLFDQFGALDNNGHIKYRRLVHYYLDSLHQAYTVNKRNFDDDHDGKIDEDELDGIDNDSDWSRDPITHQLMYDHAGHLIDDLGSDDLPDSLEIGCKGHYDPVTNPDPAFDNYDPSARDYCHPNVVTGTYPYKNDKNKYTQNNGIPDHGEPHVDEDFGAFSNHDLYFGTTDTVPQPQNPTHPLLHVKVWARSYAWNDYYQCALPIEFFFVNIGKKPIHDVFVGFFADMDVGPVSDGGYYNNNYAGYFPYVHTAYVHNPLEIGSTPLGLALIYAPGPLEYLNYTFQWHGFNPPCGGTVDSALYGCMSCEAFDYTNCIRNDQPKIALSDTRFIFSIGNKHYNATDSATWHQNPKFTTLNPGDTIKIEVAFVTGDALEDGENNMLANVEELSRSYDTYPPDGVLPTPLPVSYALEQNYPNPFNPTTVIRYSLPEKQHVTITVYNILGNEVARLVDGEQAPGNKTVTFDAKNIPTGVYYYRIKAGSFTATKKMMVVR